MQDPANPAQYGAQYPQYPEYPVMQTSPPVNQYTHHPSTTRNSLTGQETFTSTAYPKFEYRNAGFPQNLVFALSRFDSTKTGALTHEE
eukprot:3479114-Rhodomonas_salina.1